MRDVFWKPATEREEDRRPFLEAPRPMVQMPWDPPCDDVREEDEAPRVVIIDI